MTTLSSNCKDCGLYRGIKSYCVPGRGSKTPKVMFIGQAPGREEDERGECFVGPAGKLLIQAINKYRLKPAFLTNTVKCMPPGDRAPFPKECSDCKRFLYDELGQLQPEFVVPLGSVAWKNLGFKTTITHAAGKEVDLNGFRVFPMFHPAYVLREPSKLGEFERQVRRLSHLLHEDSYEVENSAPYTVEAAKEVVYPKENALPVMFDYETTGITKSNAGKLRCVAFSNGRDTCWVRADTKDFNIFMKNWLQSDVRKGAFNSGFEQRVSMESFGVWARNLVWDPMAMHHVMKPGEGHALDVLAETLLEVEPWDLGLDADEYATVDIQKLGNYCLLDADYAWKLGYKFWFNDMTKGEKWVYRNILLPLARVSAELEINGVKFDRDYAGFLREKYLNEMDKYETSVLESKRLANTVKTTGAWNLNSADQIRKLFIDGLGLNVKVETEGGKKSMKESVLEKFRAKHPEVDAYLKWKQRKTVINNYLEKFPDFVAEDGLIHANYNPNYVVSGRFSVTKPPLQAMPAELREVRGMIVSRFKGGKIVSLDYNQFEMRIMASQANEDRLIEAYNKKRDIHSLTAELVFGKGFTDVQRSLAKRMNFSMANGVTEYTMADQFNMTEEEAARLIKKFWAAYPKLYAHMRKTYKETRETLRAYNEFGRKRIFNSIGGLREWQVEAMEREGGNHRIQSTGADITNLALIEISRTLRECKCESVLITTTHDSITLDTHPLETDSVVAMAKKAMEEVVPEKYGCKRWLRVPLLVDVKIGERWS